MLLAGAAGCFGRQPLPRLWLIASARRSIAAARRRASRALTAAYGARVEAVPILAVHGPHVPRKGITLSSGAHILRPSLLATWILRYGPRLDRDEVTRLQQAAERAFPPYL